MIPPPSRFHWTMFWFLCGFIVLLTIVSYAWLIPGLAAAADASPVERKRLAALSTLLLAVILTIVLSAMVLLFGLGKKVFPRKSAPRDKTAYPDAWAEAGKRTPVPPREDQGE